MKLNGGNIKSKTRIVKYMLKCPDDLLNDFLKKIPVLFRIPGIASS
jgi:hypothetical protein